MAWYGSGQLFLEEYHVMAMMLKAGVRTVEYREYPEVEHMMIVPIALPEVFALFDRAAKR